MAESQPVTGREAGVPLSKEGSDSEPENSHAQGDAGPESADALATPRKKKGKGKMQKNAAATSTDSSSKVASKMTPHMMDSLLENNPALKGELSSMDKDQAREMLKKMDVSQLLTGLSVSGKSKTDMASYKFWQTQPVPKFNEKVEDDSAEGPIQEVIAEKIPKSPAPLPEGYEWCELDLTKDVEIKEVYELLSHHYVEDEKAMFRFNYSQSFFNWALKAPDWKKSWHVGVRAAKSRLLVASIFGIPTKLRIRKSTLPVVEINFLCIHKKLRSKRLTPVLIREITRRCHLEGIYQAIYTAGIILPTPVASCRYFHRSLDWLKLYEVGFSPLPPNSTKARMISRNQLPVHNSTPGLRLMTAADIDSVLELLSRYLGRFDLAPEFTRAEVEHWFLDATETPDERVIWAYVVDGEAGKVTDIVSFYCLESSVIDNKIHEKVRAAYLFYYASETALAEKEKGLRERLQSLVGDALVEAKKAKFDVFNALTMHDNPLFLDHLKFGPGDGQLHYYLYNYRTAPIAGGVDKRNMPDERKRGGIGMVLL